jgi:hypothetical protein
MNNLYRYQYLTPESSWAELCEFIHQIVQIQKENEKTRAENEQFFNRKGRKEEIVNKHLIRRC